MESSVCGQPGEPPSESALAEEEVLAKLPWRNLAEARFGLTFEQEGLRAQAEILRK
jgi:hypothetical protein